MKIFAKDRALTPSNELIRPSIDLVRNHVSQIVYLSLLPSIVFTTGSILMKKTFAFEFAGRYQLGLGLFIAGLIWSIIVTPGFFVFAVRLAQGIETETKQAFKEGLSHIGPFIATNILSGLMIIIGLVFFIIPGLLALRSFILAPYYVVDQNLAPAEALRKSYRDSLPVSGWIWGTIGITLLFEAAAVFIGIIPLVGTIASIAISYLYIFAPALRYTEVAGRPTILPKQ